ncbi:MAG: carboxypeptidase M32 [Lachnospiraceae bacterium]|nr:carboxypeptidase M32 [Lachnospiraceae bacterium]
MSALFEEIKPYMDKGMAAKAALTLLEWDQETLAPPMADEWTAKVVGGLSNIYLESLVNDDVKKKLEKLQNEREFSQLSVIEQAIVKEWENVIQQLDPIPQKEYQAYTELVARAGNIWAKAKEKNDFRVFCPYLKEIVEYKRKFAMYRKKARKDRKIELYDILLEDYEPGFTIEKLDSFFEEIKKELVPFIQKVVKKGSKKNYRLPRAKYNIEKQQEFCKWLAGYVGFDFSKGVLGESEHPFSTNLHNHDVRISDHYYEENLESAIFSIIHETGHALYEFGIDSEITMTLVGFGTSMGMHESQSRFYENIIGRSESFWKPIYIKLQETFPEQLQNVPIEDFIQAINRVEPGMIRTEADELTYSLHVLVRYEAEKMLLSKEIEVEDLPGVWNEKYEEYLGVSPDSDKNGVLQDVHWSCGDFGYFPSYALGTAVSAQIYKNMQEVMPVEEYLENGNLLPIRDYLKEHIYQYGKRKNTNEILEEMTGEEFNASYYIQYLKEKYSKLYDINGE